MRRGMWRHSGQPMGRAHRYARGVEVHAQRVTLPRRCRRRSWLDGGEPGARWAQVRTCTGLGALDHVAVEAVLALQLVGVLQGLARVLDVHRAEVERLLEVVARRAQRVCLVERQLPVERELGAELGNAFLRLVGAPAARHVP